MRSKPSCRTQPALEQMSEPRTPAVTVTIVEDGPTALAAYARMPIAFTVESKLRLEVVDRGLRGFELIEEQVAAPYVKDYDEDAAEGPLSWSRLCDVSRWGILSAFDGEERVGGAAVAWGTPEIHMLEGRIDLAALWDIRVAIGHRRRGIGAKLFTAAVDWARKRGCRMLKAETQNVNVAACRFYAAQGCVLRGIHAGAYPAYPDEVQLLWYLDL